MEKLSKKYNIRFKFLRNSSGFDKSNEFKIFYDKEKAIKVEFHSNRDFFNLVRLSALELSKYKSIDDNTLVISTIEKYIERNYGGMDIEIDKDLDLEMEQNEDNKNLLKELLDCGKKKVSSIFLFKKIFNFQNKTKYIISTDNLDKYNLNKAINDNISNTNSRYLLLEIKSSLAPLILQNLKKQYQSEKNITYIEGSPFINDKNNE